MKWISVKDRLPENYNLVLVKISSSISENYLLMRYHPSNKIWHYDNRFLMHDEEITHWMFLPEPPLEIAAEREATEEEQRLPLGTLIDGWVLCGTRTKEDMENKNYNHALWVYLKTDWSKTYHVTEETVKELMEISLDFHSAEFIRIYHSRGCCILRLSEVVMIEHLKTLESEIKPTISEEKVEEFFKILNEK